MKKFLAALLALPVIATAAPRGGTDADTRAWWATTTMLSNDGMEGRDTGSGAYRRAADIVAARFKAAGLKPIGPDGSWFQQVRMQQVSIVSAHIAVGARPLGFLKDFTAVASAAMPRRLDAPLAYRGYCSAAVLGDVRGKMVICHGNRRAGLPVAAQRQAAVEAAGAVGMITVIDPGFTIEPTLWPPSYARTVRLAAAPTDASPLLRLTVTPATLATLIRGSGKNAAEIIVAGSRSAPLPAFDIPETLHSRITFAQQAISAPNIVGLLPGTDPALADAPLVVSAHLDGIGHGTPVNGDGLYNGTLDDAAYVALLIRLAERRHGKGYRRPVIFAAFTGEEKGLLGARWFITHPLARYAADINLDQLRPIFPLNLLTVHALDDTSLGEDVRSVAAGLGVAVQHDPEPERMLLQRADHWPFLQAGIPATGFVFGYRPGSPSERIYRHWYRTGYHKPQDDLNQPIDWKAARDFNRFFYALVEKVAEAKEPPSWRATSPLRPAAGRPK